MFHVVRLRMCSLLDVSLRIFGVLKLSGVKFMSEGDRNVRG